MSEHSDQADQAVTTPSRASFLETLVRLFFVKAVPSTLFIDMSERLARQNASGELKKLTAHEER